MFTLFSVFLPTCLLYVAKKYLSADNRDSPKYAEIIRIYYVKRGMILARSLLLILVGCLVLLVTFPVFAADLSLGVWQASGSQVWRTSFPWDGGPGASELVYPQSGKYIIASYENKLQNKTLLHIEGGFTGNIQAATGSDSDWKYADGPGLYYYGEFKTTGNSMFINIDWKKAITADSEFFFGYGYRRNNFRMTDGTYYIDEGNAVLDPLSGLNSTYDIYYHSFHVGATAQTKLSPVLTLMGTLSYSPLAAIQGNGWWNLRSLSFTHSGVGQMWDGTVGLRYAPAGRQDASVTVGYRYQYLSLYTGTEDISSTISWEKATNVQKGYYVTSEYRF